MFMPNLVKHPKELYNIIISALDRIKNMDKCKNSIKISNVSTSVLAQVFEYRSYLTVLEEVLGE